MLQATAPGIVFPSRQGWGDTMQTMTPRAWRAAMGRPSGSPRLSWQPSRTLRRNRGFAPEDPRVPCRFSEASSQAPAAVSRP